jgi:transcription elongation factor Elf1
MDTFKKCDACGGNTSVITCESNKKVGEFYCSKCHKSYLMPEEVNLYWIKAKRQGA